MERWPKLAHGAREAGVLIRPVMGAIACSPPLSCEQAEFDFLAEGTRAGLEAIGSASPRPEESSGG